jgi:hypothetical protein
MAMRLVTITPTSNFAVQLPIKPALPKNWSDLKHDPNREHWFNAVMERYTKNHRVGLWSIPVDRSKIPEKSTVLRSVSSFKIKNTIVDNIWDLYFRLCANGASME